MIDLLTFFILSTALSAHPGYCAQTTTPELPEVYHFTFAQAPQEAFNRRASLQASQFRIEARKQDAWTALSDYFPKVHLITNFAGSKNHILPRADALFEIDQLIFSFANPRDRFYIAQQNTLIAQHLYNQNRDTIQIAAETSFLDAWLTMQRDSAIAARSHAAHKTIEAAHNQRSVGLLGINDLLSADAAYQTDMAVVLQHDDTVATSLYNLERQTKVTIAGPLATPSTLEQLNADKTFFSCHDLDSYRHAAFLNRKELKIAHEEIERERLTKEFFAKKYFPSISIFYRTRLTEFKPQALPNITLWEAGARFTWEFDGFGYFFEKKAAEARMWENVFNKQRISSNIKLEVETTYYELETLMKDLKAQEALFAQADNEWKLQQLNYEIGIISGVDLATAHQTLLDAQFSLLTAQTAVSSKHRELLFTCGYPQEWEKLSCS